jgi:hypothetical protein
MFFSQLIDFQLFTVFFATKNTKPFIYFVNLCRCCLVSFVVKLRLKMADIDFQKFILAVYQWLIAAKSAIFCNFCSC